MENFTKIKWDTGLFKAEKDVQPMKIVGVPDIVHQKIFADLCPLTASNALDCFLGDLKAC